MQEMRTACKDRLLSWERCEAAAHQALLVASAHDASAVGEEEEDAAEEEAKARTARSELGQLCSRCRTHSAALRLQCAEATLACAGAALAADDCIEEIRRASTLSILRSALLHDTCVWCRRPPAEPSRRRDLLEPAAEKASGGCERVAAKGCSEAG